MRARPRLWAAALAALLAVLLAIPGARGQEAPGQEERLPPRSEWHASASSASQTGMEPARAIDGDEKTEWGGAFAPGQWLEVDLGRPAVVGAVLIHWDLAFAHAYLILTSVDGEHWETAYETGDSPGGIDYAIFKPVRARYIRLQSAPRTTDWGVSVFEVELLAASDTPRISGLAKDVDPTSLWSGARGGIVTARSAQGASELDVKLPKPLPVTGLEVFWESAREDAQLEGRDTAGKWHVLCRDPGSFGDHSFLAAPAARLLTQLRLTVRTRHRARPVIRRIRLLSPTQPMTRLKSYEIVASRAHSELFPSSLHDEQVYWTEVGVAAGEQKSLFDEYGDVEPVEAGPLIQPLWRDASGRAVAAYDVPRKHTLRGDSLPMPAVEWSPQPGLTLRSEAIAAQESGGDVTFVRHRLENGGTSTVDGQFALIVRPMQVNPPWQHGGLAPITDVAITGTMVQPAVVVNGRQLFTSLTPARAGGVSPFGPYGTSEITQYIADGRVPAATRVRDASGLATAALLYPVHLAPGARQDIVVAFPLYDHARPGEVSHAAPPAPAAPSADPSADFDALATRVEGEWRARLERVGLSLPDQSLVSTLRAQIGYMLINQKGPALLAGPRNYDRSFIRDGSATAEVLLRMGSADVARTYLAWYASHAVHPNGLISPIINDDGSVNRGVGSDLEYDSQGEFISLVAALARLDGGAASVREYLPAVRDALRFLEELRARTLVAGYMEGNTDPQRFRGILAPSISHEGYAVPTHSYWDDYWALKGWHDGAWLAREWGEKELAVWADGQYTALRASLAASIRSTMAWKQVDYIPASADLGDSDPSSVSIGLDPCGQQDLLPPAALAMTFARYLQEVRTRMVPDARYTYTPYEFRNVLTFVHLGRPDDAEELLDWLRSGRRPDDWQVFAEVVRSQLRAPFYLGDMPHTWVGSEYVRAVLGMLMHEDDDALELLPGVPRAWLEGPGLSIDRLPTAFGSLSLSARMQDATLHVSLLPGLDDQAALTVSWPSHTRPTSVTVDGEPRADFTADGIRLSQPFRELIARWQNLSPLRYP